MTDLHSHLLYGFDDGAADRDTACRMLEIYAANGVETVVCTGHSNADTGSKYDDCFAQTSELAAGYDVKLLPALEHSLPDALNARKRPLGAGKYLLLDPALFPVDSAMLTRLMPLNAAGFSILWAHPERLYSGRALKTVDKFSILSGSACQLNAGSFTGAYGDSAKSAAWELLTANRCAVIASDAHSPEGVINFVKARKMLASLYPEDFIRIWFEINPGRILAGKNPECRQPPPLTFAKRLKRFFM